MKLFTVTVGGSQLVASPGIVPERFTLKNGTEIPSLLLGEHGRGRALEVVAMPHATIGETYGYGELGETRAGKPKIRVGKHEDDEYLLIAVLASIGFRGSNALELPSEGSEIITAGRIAQGAAGRAGAGSQWLLKLPKNESFSVTYGGRLYGASSKRTFFLNDGDLVGLTPDEMDLLEEV
jgi:hypothetical protein